MGFRARDLFMPVGVAGLAILLALVQRAAPGVTALVGLAVCVPMFACFALAGRPARFALGVGALLLVNNYFAGADHGTLERVERNFYGVKRVMTDRTGAYRMLVHGGTNHGAQALTQERAREAVTYYHHTGPIGDVFATLPTAAGKRRIGVIGLGTGSLATYLTPGDTATFYEIDPAVARIAEEPRYFTFLSDCRAGYRIVLGDGRLTIAEAPAHGFDLIVLDAFSSDAIPTHLLTREALATYAEKLAPGGWIAFHVSNNFVDLRPLLAELAADAGLACYGRTDRAVPEALRMIGKTPSVWVVMARRGEELTPLVEKGSWEATKRRAGLALWTDQYSNLTSLMHW